MFGSWDVKEPHQTPGSNMEHTCAVVRPHMRVHMYTDIHVGSFCGNLHRKDSILEGYTRRT